MSKNNSFEEMMTSIDKLDDELFVQVKIDFLLEIMNAIKRHLINDKKLESIIVSRMESMKLLKSMDRGYIKMSACDLKYVLYATRDVLLHRHMIVIKNQSRK